MGNDNVVLIVLNYNQNNYSFACIDSIIISNYKDYKILLIDNGSVYENFVELKNHFKNLKNDKIKLFRIEKNIGYVGGTNFGLSECQKYDPQYILIMNNDTILAPNAIHELVNTCKKYNNEAIVSGKVYDYHEKNKLQFVGYSYKNRKYLTYNALGTNEIDNGQFDSESERDMLDDIFWLFPSKLIDDVGYYSDYFWFNAEQQDFGIRAMNKGYKLIYTPNAKIWHKGSVSIGGRVFNPAHAYWFTQSELIVRKLHLSIIDFLRYYFLTIFGILSTYVKVPILLLKGINRFTYANAKLRGLMAFNKWVINPKPNNGFNPYLKK